MKDVVKNKSNYLVLFFCDKRCSELILCIKLIYKYINYIIGRFVINDNLCIFSHFVYRSLYISFILHSISKIIFMYVNIY